MPTSPVRSGNRSRRPPRWGAAFGLVLAAAAGAAALSAAGGPSTDLATLGEPALRLTDPRRALLSSDDWLNRRPLTAADLKGKVVLVNFWTYSCINSLRPLPYLREWARRYADQGLVVVGVHTPEFAFEGERSNVRQAIQDLGIGYPVALDRDYRLWNAFGNDAWPAFYVIGADGRLRGHIDGEGRYAQTEALIRKLLSEPHGRQVTASITAVAGIGVQAAPDWPDIASPETYVGYAKAERFQGSGALRRDADAAYQPTSALALNHWGLQGAWKVGGEFATLAGGTGAIRYRFHARDLNLVLAPPLDGSPARVRVLIDGAPPAGDHGFDVGADGWGRLDRPRLYQLIRQTRPVTDRTAEVEIIGAGARAYVFTFG